MLTRASRPVDQESVTIPLLEGLDPDAAREIRQRLEPVSIAGDAILFEQGDRADSLYVLVSGAVGIATVDQATGVARRLARMQPPEIVGDVALLTNGVRSARATALRDSLLLRLDKDAFDEIAARHPGAMLYCARKLADRLRAGAGPQRYEQAPVTFAVAAVTEGVRASDFAHRLTAALGERALCLTTWPEGADETWFHTLETSRSHVIYATDAAVSAWGQLCLRRADHVLLLAAPERPALPPLRQIGARAPDVWRRYDLVVVQPAGALTPRRIDPGLGTPAVAMRHHVRDGRAADLARLGRLICRRGQGLVLGGGGARGFAHIGVLRALREAGYAVDHVGGPASAP
nr:cyclic nucleotide-binding and patatin-like phospholipase domain-containing protein [Methylobacterium durans]